MEVIVGKHAGFCAGVKNAVKMTTDAADENTYCLGEVVHNKQVIEELEKKGLKFVNDISNVPDNSRMIIRAHGEGEIIYELAKKRNIEIIDTTCGNVKLVHNKINKAKKDSFILIIGEKNHAEVLGDIGFAGNNYYVIEDESDILDAYMEFENSGLNNIYAVAQTTYSSAKFDKIEKEIYINFIEANVVVDKTICNATEIRQSECAEIAKKVDCMVVIGGKNSANTRKLVEISSQSCEKVYFIQTVDDLKNMQFDNIEKIGIMAGASTPDYIIKDVKKYLEEV